MTTIEVKTPSKNYPVYIGVDGITQLLTFVSKYKKAFIVTDENVANYHLEPVLNGLSYVKTDVHHIVIPPGETSKSFETYEDIMTKCIEANLTRDSLIIALGGGVVGDIAGFVAATYMRGIQFIQVPTTLLAHDSAVGGKVAINHKHGKNLVGAFHQPEAVFYHLPFLYTLPDREYYSGFGEMIKEALISDVAFYNELKATFCDLNDLKYRDYTNTLIKAMRVKANIVSADERETGVRAYLNFGHTLGHAIEKCEHVNLSHGECVVHGMLFALELSKELFGLDFDIVAFQDWLTALGYEKPSKSIRNTTKLMDFIKVDKKNTSEKLGFIALKKIGEPEIVHLDVSYVQTKLEEWLAK